MFSNGIKLCFVIIVILSLLLSIVTISISFAGISAAQPRRQVTITTILDDEGDPPRALEMFYQPALQDLRARHPDLDIKLDYRPIPYLNLRAQFLKTMTNQTPVDIMTVDQLWLGEFVQKGFVTDITNRTYSWGRESEWYPANWASGIYNHKVYGILPYTDVRGLWYWKDLLNKSGVDPNSLKTWDGYIASAKKLNAALRPLGIEGIHLTGANHSPDLWYPYLWMLGGKIMKERDGHPTKGTYWFPAYNSSAGVIAMEFIKAQIDAGIKPQKQHFWGKEFLDRKFAVMLEALQHHVHLNTTAQIQDFENKVGFLPFPVPDESYHSSTLMGGWLFSIPVASKNKDLAWELVREVLEPKMIAPWLAKYGYLPTQIPIGQGPFSGILNQSIPYYSQLISMVSEAGSRPS